MLAEMLSPDLLRVEMICNVIICLSYIGLSIQFSRKFDAAAPNAGLALARLCAHLFFVGCACTHGIMVHDYWIGTHWMPGGWMGTPISLCAHGLQAVAAPGFLLLSEMFGTIRIYHGPSTRAALERWIGEQVDSMGPDDSRIAKDALRAMRAHRIDHIMEEIGDV